MTDRPDLQSAVGAALKRQREEQAAEPQPNPFARGQQRLNELAERCVADETGATWVSLSPMDQERVANWLARRDATQKGE
jgi:hypothetical protein